MGTNELREALAGIVNFIAEIPADDPAAILRNSAQWRNAKAALNAPAPKPAEAESEKTKPVSVSTPLIGDQDHESNRSSSRNVDTLPGGPGRDALGRDDARAVQAQDRGRVSAVSGERESESDGSVGREHPTAHAAGASEPARVSGSAGVASRPAAAVEGTGEPCRKCAECDGASHHWIDDLRDPEDDDFEPGEYGCKHCPQRGHECSSCGGDGCERCGQEGVVPLTERDRITELERRAPSPAPVSVDGAAPTAETPKWIAVEDEDGNWCLYRTGDPTQAEAEAAAAKVNGPDVGPMVAEGPSGEWEPKFDGLYSDTSEGLLLGINAAGYRARATTADIKAFIRSHCATNAAAEKDHRAMEACRKHKMTVHGNYSRSFPVVFVAVSGTAQSVAFSDPADAALSLATQLESGGEE